MREMREKKRGREREVTERIWCRGRGEKKDFFKKEYWLISVKLTKI